MRAVRKAAWCAVLLGLAAGQAAAQDDASAVATCVSAGVAEAPAAFAEFTIRYAHEAATAVDTVAGAAQFEENLRQTLALKELKGIELRGEPPLLTRYAPPRAETVVTLRANLNALAGDSGAQLGFALLLDELGRISEALNCQVSLPHYRADDEAELIARAVRAAAEGAFAPADAAAASLRARIFTVDQIDVLDHGFDRPEEPIPGWRDPGARAVLCWARVKVTYLLMDE